MINFDFHVLEIVISVALYKIELCGKLKLI